MNMCELDKSLRAVCIIWDVKSCNNIVHTAYESHFSKLLLHDSTLNMNLIASDTGFFSDIMFML